MSYNGETSTPKELPGGGPQGAYLGGIIFIVKYNGAFLRPPIPRHITGPVLKSKSMKVKYIDDGTVATSVDLKKCLIEDPINRERPLNFHERTQHILPVNRSSLQKQLQIVEDFTDKNLMKINESKSKIMIFNKSRKYDFPPEYAFRDGQILEVLEESKLLGIQLTTDLRWFSNTKEIFCKAMSRIWLLRRMKALKLEPTIILDYYIKEIRSLAEQGVPVWNSGLTKGQINDLEKIQKVSLKAILLDDYKSYDQACRFFNLERLSDRRLNLATNFAVKLFLSDRSEQFFTHTQQRTDPRVDQPLVVESLTRTKRCFNAPHNYLARIVNQNKRKIVEKKQ